MNWKEFYEMHKNFACRTRLEYYLSPGIRCKFDILADYIKSNQSYSKSLDLGCSGNSFLFFINKKSHKSFLDISSFPLSQYKSKNKLWHPIQAEITHLPYKNNNFDLISALDVLEHVKNDEIAVAEMNRVLKRKGKIIITVPHRKKYYTLQDKIIGHYRRYEIPQIISLFQENNLSLQHIFSVYGRLMKIANIQSINPDGLEHFLEHLREHYENSNLFRKLWDLFVIIASKIMKFESNHISTKNIMNIGFIFEKS
jgi:ubiquinone/menaquinone biosynthesis C-methylase UbiE